MLISVPIIYVLFILLFLIVGRIDTILGLREEEFGNFSTSNPLMREILQNMEEIKMKLNDIKAKTVTKR